VTIPEPGCDEVVLTAPGRARPCHSRACADAARLAEVIATFGVLNDPFASYYRPGALWRECWGVPVPMCEVCWDSSRQVAVRYRPGLAVIDATRDGPAPAAGQTAGGRA
jgi:hypothetical protein